MEIQKRTELSELLALGLSPEKLDQYEMFILPENIGQAQSESLYDAQDAITISKLLKSKGIACANSYDLGMDAPTKVRRNDDTWIGQIIIFNDLVLPIFLDVLQAYLAAAIAKWRNHKPDHPPAPTTRLKLTRVNPSGTTKLDYQGDPETLIKIIKLLDKP